MHRLARLPRAATAAVAAGMAVWLLEPLPLPAEASSSPPPVAYQPPVDSAVVDGFRPPATAYGPGNRGIDYATAPGDVVRASAPGVVVFAGPVGGSLHVVVLHDDGVRTTYSFLGSIGVRRGRRVDAGEAVGSAGLKPLHFGARVGDEYIDPMALLAAPPTHPHVRLVPDDGKGLPPERAERSALERLMRLVARATGVPPTAVAWAAGRMADGAGGLSPEALGPLGAAMARYAATGDAAVLARDLWAALPDPDLAPLVADVLANAAMEGDPAMALAVGLSQWGLRRGPCTPRSARAPVLRQRRLAVLVGGLGSSSGHAAIRHLDTESLGYRPGDRVQFSYRGGRAEANPYTSADTQIDPAEAGRRLRRLLEDLARRHPGVPIDVFAHSQGGLVARAALAEPGGGLPVAHLVTFGTPHDGADLAAFIEAETRTAPGVVAGPVAARVRPLGLDPTRPSVGALAPGSAFVRGLNRAPLPAGVRVTSIATRRDLVVPAHRSWLKGADNTVVPSHGANAHSMLPGSVEGRREAALAVTDRPPTCESVLDAGLDTATATAIGLTEHAAVLAAQGAATRDLRARRPR
ncbi:MAG: hypothetical protein QOI20_829 [Acidimicrobiaceae bacterium]|nr:hypothetical protein [Acidimicrobiaceae bacterium]